MGTTFIDDYQNKYRTPYIPQRVVGFSGIDPSSPCDYGEGGGGLSEDEINQLIALYVSNLTIRVDSGRIDPDSDEPVLPTVDLRTKDIPHNALDGLQGGQSGEYYHLTAAEYDKLKDYPLYSTLIASRLHEQLPDLLGGDANGHYHLTEEELADLRKLIAALISGGVVVLPSGGGGTDDHEQLQNLLGGDGNGHYHVTDDEWAKIKRLIAVAFPPGSTEPVIPSGPIDPEDPENPTEDPDLETDAGLPPSEPPSWGIVGLPEAYKTYAGAGNMYYGMIAIGNEAPYWFDALVMPTTYTATSTTYRRVRYTKDLSTWKDLDTSVSISTYGNMLAQCMFADFNDVSVDKDGNKYIFYMFYPATTTNIQYRKKGGTGVQQLAQPKSLAAMAYSKTLRIAIFVTDTGTVSMLKGPDRTTTTTLVRPTVTYDSKIGSVNLGSAVWLEAPKRFCVSGKDGISFSGMGETWTKKIGNGTTIPKDLRGLTFRADIEYKDSNNQTYQGCAFGWSGDDKTFWKSYDGENWMRHNARPIPLQDVKSVAYSPEYGMYCAAGTPQTGESGLYVYFSKDLAGWKKSKVSADSIEVESVIWMPSTQKFVLYPSGGSYLYTFDPKDWK